MHDFFDIFVGFRLRIIEFFGLGVYFGAKLGDARQLIDRAGVPHSETGGLLLGLLVKVLPVEWMDLDVVPTVGYTKSVVPSCFQWFELARCSMGFSSLNFAFSRCFRSLFDMALRHLVFLLLVNHLFLDNSGHRLNWLVDMVLLLDRGYRLIDPGRLAVVLIVRYAALVRSSTS